MTLEDEDWDEDGVPSSPTRRQSAASKRKDAAAKAKKNNAQHAPPDPPARMPRLTRAASAATGVQPIAGAQDPDRRARPRAPRAAPHFVQQDASPPRPHTPEGPQAGTRMGMFVPGQGPRVRPSRPEHTGMLPALPRAKRNKKKTRGGANAQRIKRPSQQVQVVDLDVEEEDDDGFDDLRDAPQDDTLPFFNDDDYSYDPRDFEDEDEQEEGGIAASVERSQDRSRSVRFSRPGADKRPSRDDRKRDSSRSRGTSSRCWGRYAPRNARDAMRPWQGAGWASHGGAVTVSWLPTAVQSLGSALLSRQVRRLGMGRVQICRSCTETLAQAIHVAFPPDADWR